MIDGLSKEELRELIRKWRKKASQMRSRAGIRTYHLAEARAAGYEACAQSIEDRLKSEPHV